MKIMRIISISLLLFILLPQTVGSLGKKALPQGMKLHFIDVGQGDSTLIETPENKIILIDGGPPGAGKKVLAYLEKQQIYKIDLVIATHPDVDHIGGLIPVLQKVPVKQVVDSGKLHSTKTYRNYLKYIRKHNIPFEIAERHGYIQLDPKLAIQVLNTYDKDKKDNNEASIVLRIRFRQVVFLLMADAKIEQEQEIMKQSIVEADILKIGHHGSNTSSSRAFIEAVQPQVALLTYSRENNFGHPVERVIRNLQRIQAQIYSTATFGNIVIWTNGEHYFVLPSKNPLDYLHHRETFYRNTS